MPRRSIRCLTRKELHSDVEKRKYSVFEDLIRKKIGDSAFSTSKPIPDDFVAYADHDEDVPQTPDDSGPVDRNNDAAFEKPLIDC